MSRAPVRAPARDNELTFPFGSGLAGVNVDKNVIRTDVRVRSDSSRGAIFMNELRKLLDLLDEWERGDDLANEAVATLSRPAELHPGELDRPRALHRDAAHKLAAVRKAVIEEGNDDPAPPAIEWTANSSLLSPTMPNFS